MTRQRSVTVNITTPRPREQRKITSSVKGSRPVGLYSPAGRFLRGPSVVPENCLRRATEVLTEGLNTQYAGRGKAGFFF